ncbi:hypothetical protein FOL47_000957 [Perkinsus chesapeaki]|uniref:RING-type domain-containing protein n=1 Tax=Perkinsus chesapeaki TaxID=330153 RepID=A0A7J6MLJ9_PERCH|nr:hypothetical protein FOL47_000957 [Perkinsus chesapeaki]
MPPSSPGPPISRLERFLRLGPRGTEVSGPRSSGSSSSSSTAATAKKATKGQAVKDARAVCLGEDNITLEDVAEVDSLAENVDSPESMWRYLELLFLPQDRRMAQLLREWLRGGAGPEPMDGDSSEDVAMSGIQSQPALLPELARAEKAMAQSSTIHYSWDWALEDAIAPREQALGVYARLGIPPPRDLKELKKSFPRVQLAGPDHTFDVRLSDRPIRTRRLPTAPFSYSPLLSPYLSNPLLQPPPPLPTLLTTSVSSSSSSDCITDQTLAAGGVAYVPPESGPQLFSEPARARSSSDESSDFAPARHRSHRLGDSTFRQLYEDLKSTYTENRELGRYILRNIMANVETEEERGQATRAFMRTLSEAAGHHVMRLEYDHWIDSVDELFPAPPQDWPKYDGKLLVVFDDCITKIRARAIDRNVVVGYLRDRQQRFMTGYDDVQQFSLTTRPLRSHDLPSEVEDDVSVPSCSDETLEGLPDLPQIGPFCHICRRSAKAVAAGAADAARKEALGLPPTSLINVDARQRSQMAVCSGVLDDAFEGWPGTTPCHRRFCHTCLVLYSHQAPIEGKPWKCPVCTKSCSCERCTRAHYIKEIRAFALANLGTGRLRDLISRPADEPREKWKPGFPVPWPQFMKMAPDSSFIIQPDAEVHRQALEIESALARKELHKAAGAAAKAMKDYTPRMSTRSSHGRQKQSGRSNASKAAVASPAATSRSAETPPSLELHSPEDVAAAFLRELVPQGAGPTSTEKLLVLRKAVERLRDVQKLRLEAVDLLSQRESTLAASLEGSGPQVLARSLLHPTPDWLPTDDLCIKDDDLADEFITALHRVLPEKRLRQEVPVEDSETEIEGGPPPDPSRAARNAVKWRRLTRRCGVRKPSSVALHPGRSRTKTAGDETDTEMMPPKHASRGRGRKPGSKRSAAAAAAATVRRPDRFPAAVHYEIMDFV